MTSQTATQLAWLLLAANFLAGYLSGSIPFGLLLSRRAGLGDIRKIGSGNIGATNVLRTGNKWLALATLLLDMAKGIVPVYAAWVWGPGPVVYAVAAAAGAVIGHMFPSWLGFKGGKGVATGLGVVLALNWDVGLAACATWLLVAVITRYSSLAALTAFAAAPFYAYSFADSPAASKFLHATVPTGWHSGFGPLIVQFLAALAILIWARHTANITRLLSGTEPRIGR